MARLKFDDNSLISLLCGEHDKHLAHMEKALGVSIVPRGNFLSLSGPADAVATARSGLQDLYDRLSRGLPVDSQEVEAVLRLGPPEKASGSAVDENLVIRTRKRHISPRSKNQAAYLQALRDGVEPEDITGTASGDLMRMLIKGEDYARQGKDWL